MNSSVVTLASCLGLLSFWKMNLYPSLYFFAAGFLSKMALLPAPSIFQSISNSFHVSAEKKDAHHRMNTSPEWSMMFFLFYLIQHLNILCFANLFKPYIMKSGSKFLWFAVFDVLLHIAKFLTRSLFSLTFFYILAYLRFSFSQFSTCLLLWPKGLDLSHFILSPSLLFISILYAIPFLELCYLAVSVLPFSIPSLEALSSPQRSGASHSISSHLVMQHEGHHPGFVVLTHWSSLPWHT